ncbi:nitrogenase-stabilizing/protective protein [Rhizomicrobium palustre]|uniref:Nitrogenase-stabilizing/protective protein NifW n=1 Tax=Rhizomicrobium palustre TaxID=189966 RepID=A0A846N0I5_9PROT|nr:nitrogenase-stabilizing/protective protein NifW [Rhizomicrobium palustre]NIK89196.1 nitrogenase-stabilizing/protective protein [Rhizomicrobium palustre]
MTKISNFDADLQNLSSAEDFFAYFGLDFDKQVMAASRLHILKRFHDHLSQVEGLQTLPEAEKRDAYRQQLERAYASFLTGNALTERVFPRLAAAKGAFVALSSLRAPNKAVP